MRRWELTVALDPSRQQPLVVQLSSAIAEDIRSGRLKSGDPLPGSRELAERLGVSRNTVVASYQELAAEGLVSSRVGAGTLVSTPPPGPTSGVLPPLPEPTYELGARRKSPPVSRPPPHGALMMSRGVPDPRLLPSRPLARAFARAIGKEARRC
jgi:GntR family transcriptional regulator/MocR family aminotransferase